MNMTLLSDLESCIEASVRSGTSASASELVEASVRCQMQAEAGLEDLVTPLTGEDLDSVRDLVRQARARQAA